MKVWVALSLYPESSDYLLATTKEGLVHAIRDRIDDGEFEQALGEPPGDRSDLEVVEEYFDEIYVEVPGDPDSTIYVGEEWAIRQQEVIGS